MCVSESGPPTAPPWLHLNYGQGTLIFRDYMFIIAVTSKCKIRQLVWLWAFFADECEYGHAPWLLTYDFSVAQEQHTYWTGENLPINIMPASIMFP